MMSLKITLPLLLMSSCNLCIIRALSEVETKESTYEETISTVALISEADSSSTERVKKDVSHRESINELHGDTFSSSSTPLSFADNDATSSINNYSYQPYIEYGNITPQSQSITRIALGKEAIEIFRQNENKGLLNPANEQVQNVLYLPPELKKSSEQNYIQPQYQYHQQNQQQLIYLPIEQQQPNSVYVTLPPPIPKTYYLQETTQTPTIFRILNQQGDYNNVDRDAHYTPAYITPQPQVPQPPAQEYLTIPKPLIQNYHGIPSYIVRVNHIVHNTPEIQKYEPIESKNVKNETNQEKNVIDEKKNYKETEELVESRTAKAIIEEYEKHYVKKQVEVLPSGDSGAITKMHRTPHSLSEDPIVVPDYDNNLNYEKQAKDEESLKQKDSSKAKQFVTPRPLGITFLAPITAGIQLQSVENEAPKKPKVNVEVEIQKSVPYYLGKFEFVQKDHPRLGRHEEARSNVALGTTLLKYYNHGPNGQISYGTIYDQRPEPGQIEYKVAPPSNILHQQHYYLQQPTAKPNDKINYLFAHQPQQFYFPSINYKHYQPIKTHQDYAQKPKITKLYPEQAQQNIPYKMHQEVSKIPIKSYTYATNHQLSYAKKKPKTLIGDLLINNAQYRPSNDYIGMKPPHLTTTTYNRHFKPSQQIFSLDAKKEEVDEEQKALIQQSRTKYRSPRHSFGEIRLEYGFKPPLIPSIEIDEYGKPLDKKEE